MGLHFYIRCMNLQITIKLHIICSLHEEKPLLFELNYMVYFQVFQLFPQSFWILCSFAAFLVLMSQVLSVFQKLLHQCQIMKSFVLYFCLLFLPSYIPGPLSHPSSPNIFLDSVAYIPHSLVNVFLYLATYMDCTFGRPEIVWIHEMLSLLLRDVWFLSLQILLEIVSFNPRYW